MDDETRRIRKAKWLSQSSSSNSRSPSFSSSSSSISIPSLSINKYTSGIIKNEGPRKKIRTNVIDLLSSDEDDNMTKAQTKSSKKTKINGQTNSSARISPQLLSICTYNIWFGPPCQKERMSEIFSLLTTRGEAIPVLLGLQEVTPYLGEQCLFPLLRSAGYHILSQDIEGTGYGCAIAILTSRTGNSGRAKVINSGFYSYSQTIMDRGFVWVEAKIMPENCSDESEHDCDGTHVLFTTTHLESFMPNYQGQGKPYNGASQRESQILEASEFCKDYIKKMPSRSIALITGDLNWDDERKKSKGVDKPLLSVIGNEEWIDIWLKSRPENEGYTYDAKKSPMLGGNLRRRFDRCLVYQKEEEGISKPQIDIKKAHLIGIEPIDGLEWKKEVIKWRGGSTGEYKVLQVLPSDHYGLHVTLDITGKLE